MMVVDDAIADAKRRLSCHESVHVLIDEIKRLRTAIRQHREHINNQAKHGPTEQADAALWSVLDA